MTNQVIPAEAVRAAFIAIYERNHIGGVGSADIRRALEAAAPYMLAALRAELVNLATDFDSAEGGTLAYTSPNGLRKNAHDQLMYIAENYLGEQPHD
jgi:hypothetical protein